MKRLLALFAVVLLMFGSLAMVGCDTPEEIDDFEEPVEEEEL